MFRTLLLAASLLAFAACGGAPPQITPDAPDATPPPDTTTPPPDTMPPATTITIETQIAPTLVAFREGTGPWQTPRSTGPSTFVAEVHGPYSVAAVCEDETSVSVYADSRTPDDDHTVIEPCRSILDGLTATVSGHVVQPGRANLGFLSRRSTVPEWDFALSAAPGTTELVVASSDRVAVRRGIFATGAIDTVLPPIDLAQEGAALVAASIAITGTQDDEGLLTLVTLKTPATSGRVSTAFGGQISLAPDAVITAADDQTVRVIASSSVADSPTQLRRDRSITRKHVRAAAVGSYPLPEPLGPVQFTASSTDVSAAFSALAAYDKYDLVVFGLAGKLQVADMLVSANYLAATGATSIALAQDLPGMKPEWRLDPTTHYDRGVNAFRFADELNASASVTETLNVPVEPPPPDGFVASPSRSESLAERYLRARH